MNQAKIEKKLTDDRKKEVKARIDKCIPIVNRIMEMMTEKQLPMGEDFNADLKEYKEISLEIITLMVDENMSFWDKELIFQLLQQRIDGVKSNVVNSIAKSFEIASAKLWGIDPMYLTLQDIDKVMKANKEDLEKTD